MVLLSTIPERLADPSEAFTADMCGTGLGVVRTITATLGSFGRVLFSVITDRGLFDEDSLGCGAITMVMDHLTSRMSERSTARE